MIHFQKTNTVIQLTIIHDTFSENQHSDTSDPNGGSGEISRPDQGVL